MNKTETRRRRRSAVVAALAAVALVITGTFAWRSISQNAINNVRRAGDETGARLHDDYDAAQDPEKGANKDVYVENYSGLNDNNPDKQGEPVYVRVRLREYMEIGDGAGLFGYTAATGTPGASPGPEDYQGLDEAGTGGVRSVDTANEAEPVIDTNPDTGAAVTVTDVTTWPIHVPGSSAGEDGTAIDDYWNWTMGGSKVFMPTFNKDSNSLLTDRTENAHDEYSLSPLSIKSDAAYYADPAFTGLSETHAAKSTQTTAAVLTMADWIAAGYPAEDDGNGYWVGDVDGWFYWSKPLPQGEATGLLLDSIQMPDSISEDMYYAIRVESQMATAGDWGEEAEETGFYQDGLTDNALELLNRAAGITPTVTSPAAGVANGGIFTDDKGIEWQVLTTDEDGNKLVMTTNRYHWGTQYNNTSAWTAYGSSNLMIHATSGLAYFYTNEMGSDIKAVALPVTITDKRTGANTPDLFSETENGTTYPSDISKARSATASATNTPFVLSIAEYNTYKGSIRSSGSNLWWLRTPGDSALVGTASLVSAAGGAKANVANSINVGYRTALWIRS